MLAAVDMNVRCMEVAPWKCPLHGGSTLSVKTGSLVASGVEERAKLEAVSVIDSVCSGDFDLQMRPAFMLITTRLHA